MRHNDVLYVANTNTPDYKSIAIGCVFDTMVYWMHPIHVIHLTLNCLISYL